jgi:hypothetical protein
MVCAETSGRLWLRETVAAGELFSVATTAECLSPLAATASTFGMTV